MTIVKLKLHRGSSRWTTLGLIFFLLFLAVPLVTHLSRPSSGSPWARNSSGTRSNGFIYEYNGHRLIRPLMFGGSHRVGEEYVSVGVSANEDANGVVGIEEDPYLSLEREWEFRRALQYEGTGARMRAFLDKALNGKPIVVSVIGGSVSKGRGLQPPKLTPNDYTDPTYGGPTLATLYSPENMHVIVFDYLNQTFPHPENRFVNGAQGGVGSGYFGWCFNEHIPEDTDLVLVELGINDLQELNTLRSFEHLIRGLLQLHTMPAIINIETFTALFPSIVSASSLHHDILSYYDVPSLSIRDLILPLILESPETQMPEWFRTHDDLSLSDLKVREFGGTLVDMLHISAKGHALAASLIMSYINTQLSLAFVKDSQGHVFPSRAPPEHALHIPAAYLTQPTDLFRPLERRVQHCRSMNSARLHSPVSGTNDSVDTTGSTLYRGLVLSGESKGWTTWAWQEKSYLVATEPGSLAVFDFITSTPSPLDSASQTTNPTLKPPITLDAQNGPNLSGRRKPNQAAGGKLGGRQMTKREVWENSPPDSGGTVSIAYQRSARYGLGSVFCWVDDDRKSGRRMDGWWPIKEQNMGVVSQVASGLTPGPHSLKCELLDQTLDPENRREFRLFAVMHN